MTYLPLKALKRLLTLLLAVTLAAPAGLRADDHVVSAADLQKSIMAHAQDRQGNLRRLQQFFNSDQAGKALRNFPVASMQIEHAVSQLTDQELAQLAARVAKVQRDFAAGALTNQQLTYIVIALATAVIILVIVKA